MGFSKEIHPYVPTGVAPPRRLAILSHRSDIPLLGPPLAKSPGPLGQGGVVGKVAKWAVAVALCVACAKGEPSGVGNTQDGGVATQPPPPPPPPPPPDAGP